MSHSHRIRASIVGHAARLILDQGVPTGRLFRGFNLSPHQLAEPEAWITLDEHVQLWKRAYNLSDDNWMWHRYAEAMPLSVLGAIAYQSRSAPTLGEGLATMVRYQRHIRTDMRLILRQYNGQAWLLFDGWQVPDRIAPSALEGSVAVALRFMRLAFAPDLVPTQILFPHAQRMAIAGYEERFHAPVRFGQDTAGFSFPVWWLDHTAPKASNWMYTFLERRIAQSESKSTAPSSGDSGFVRAVQEQLRHQTRLHTFNLPELAAELGITARTLQRRLQEQGTSVRMLLEDLRREWALDAVANRSQSLAEVAYLAGYNDIASFTRAFSRWADMTPGKYRQQRQKREP